MGQKRQFSFLDDPRQRRGFFARLSRRLLKLVLFSFLFSVGMVGCHAVVPVAVTPLMFIRSYEAWQNDRPIGWKKDWVPISEISPRLQLAAMAAEDGRFLDHYGFDLDAIEKALRHNRKSTRRLRGASTISQQVAKNVFLWPSRSWVRKGAEAYFTVLIELFWSKRRILEVYLNVVEFGEGVYGAEAAARTYFRKPAAKLTAAEGALLTAVLPNPKRFSAARPSGYVRFRQLQIQRRMQSISAPNWAKVP